MARNLSHNLKRFVAGVCALLLMAGTIPANTDFGGLFGGSSIVAKADYMDGSLVVVNTSVTSTITNGDGWSFDADNNTLTLNGANITQCGEESGCGIYYGGSSPLSIVLVGDNTIDISTTDGDCGILAMNSLINISGTGKLTVKGKNQGIVGHNGVNFNGGTVDVEAKDFAVSGFEGITIGNATVTAKATSTDMAHALLGDVKNSIAGKGWSNAAGTEGETAIAVSETGRDLAYYRKVQFTATAATLSGNCGAQGDNVTYTLEDTDNDTNYDKLTISGTGAMADYTGTDAPWKNKISQIQTVVIGNGVTSIGGNTFRGASNLSNITIPEGVTKIGNSAFCDCTSLKAVTIPSTVTSISEYAFFYNNSRTDDLIVTFTKPENNQQLNVGNMAFNINGNTYIAFTGDGKTNLYNHLDNEVGDNSLLVVYGGLTYYWYTLISESTVIYKDDKVAFTSGMSYYSNQTTDGQAGGDSSRCYDGALCTLSDISYNDNGYKFTFSSIDNKYVIIKIVSEQLDKPPIGLEVVGGDGSSGEYAFYFKMIPAPTVVTADTPQVIKAGDKFKVDGNVSAVKIGDESPSSINIASGTVFTVSEDTNGLSVAVNDNECSLPFSVGSAKTYHVSYYYGTLIFTENKVYNSELDAFDLNIGDVLAPGASFESDGTYYFQEGNGSYQEYGYGVKFSVVAGGLKQGGTIKNNFADNKNAFVYDHYDSENDKHYFAQTQIDLGPVVTTAPTAKENLKYNGEEQALVTEGTASNGAKMQYLVVPDGKKPATEIVSGDHEIIYTPKVGAVYKPTGGIGIYFPNHHIMYNDKEYSSTGGEGNVYYDNGKTIIFGSGNNRAELPGDNDAIRVTSISDTAITVEAVKAADYAQAAYGDAATATNAGKYQVYYKAVKDDKSSDVGSVKATIAKADTTVTTAPTAKENLKYNGEEQELVNEGTVTGGTLEYGLAEPIEVIEKGDGYTLQGTDLTVGKIFKTSDYAGFIFPEGTKVKLLNNNIVTYPSDQEADGPVYNHVNVFVDYDDTIPQIYGADADANAKFTKFPDGCDALRIDKINGDTIEVTAVKSSECFEVKTWSTKIPKGTDAGEYNVFYRVKGDDNYNDVAPTKIENVKIAKADPTVTTAPTAKENLKYNGGEQELINKGVVANGTLEYGFAEPAEAIEKGEYYELSGNDLTVGKIIKPSDFSGFNFPEGTKVKLLNNNIVTYPSANEADGPVYNHVNVYLDDTTPTIYGADADDNALYTPFPDGCDALRIDKINGDTIEVTAVKSSECFEVKTWSATPPKGTDAGDYDVYYRVKGDDNYNDIAPAKIENVKIAEAEITGVTLTANEPTAVEKSGNRVRASFSATVEEGYEIVEYSIIYANDGTVTDTSELTVDKVDGTTIKTFANNTYAGLLLDKGNGVIAVGYVKVKDSNDNEFYVYTTDLGGKFAELKAKEATTLTANEPTAVVKSGNRVRASFSATVEEGYEIVEYNIIYANDGTVTDTSELTVDKVDSTRIKTFANSTYSGLLLDKGNGVIAVGYVKVKDSNNNEFYVYTTDLGGKFAELNAVN